MQSCVGLMGPTSPDEVGRTFEQSEQRQPQDEVTQAEEQLAPRVRAEQEPWAQEPKVHLASRASMKGRSAVPEVTTSREQREHKNAQVAGRR